MRRLFLFLLLALSLNAQQIPIPPTKTTSPIGTGGPFFPFFNNGTINMTSNTYTMVYPDQSASVIRVTGTLTAPGTIIAPQPMGFEFVIINATGGGFPITLQGTGTGVSIPNNTAAMVVSDGVNYIQVGSAGGNISFPGTGSALLQANTTGTVSRLTTNPTQCPPGIFAIGINVDGSANCQPASIPISNLLAATHINTLYNGTYQQLWSWHFPSTVTNSSGLALTEQDLGVGTGNSVVTISSFAGSPTTALTVAGPAQINGNLTVTGTCTGCGGGPGVGPTYPVTTLTTTSTTLVTPLDFQNHTTFVSTNAAGTPTIQLPTPAPPQGQYIWFINYVPTQPAITRAGPETLNGAAVTMFVPSSAGGASPNAWRITSTGTNYIGAKVVSGSFNTLTTGILANSQILTIGNTASMVVSSGGNLTAASTNTGNNGTINGTRYNATTNTLNVVGNTTGTAPATVANVTASGNITADTAIYSPAYFTCTTAAPCITPTSASLGRIAGGEPLSTRHLADFSDILATNGQVPIWNSTQNKYVPGPQAAGGTPSISDLIAATKNTVIPFGQYKLTLSFDPRPPAQQGQYLFQIGEIAANTTPPPNNQELVAISTFPGSTTTPLSVYTGAGFWLFNSNQQQLQARGGAKFAGPIILTDTGNPGNPVVDAPALGTDANGNIIPKAGGGVGGPASWDTITDPGGSSYLFMGNHGTLWEWDLSTSFASGLTIDDASSGNPTNQKNILSITSAFPRVAPLELWSGNNKFLFDGSGDVTISKLANAQSLAADSTGKLISGTRGGPTHPVRTISTSGTFPITVDDLAACATIVITALSPVLPLPTPMPPNGQCVRVVNMGNSQPQVQGNGATINGGANVYFLPGSGIASPQTFELVSDGVSNWTLIKISSSFANLTAGASQNQNFVVANGSQITTSGTGIVNANQINGAAVPVSAGILATNASGQLVNGATYSARHANVALLQAVGVPLLTGPTCDEAGVCTVLTPVNDGMYELHATIASMSVNTACTALGVFQLQVSFTDADVPGATGIFPFTSVGLRNVGSNPTISNNMVPGNYPGSNSTYMIIPYTMMVKGGTSVTYRMYQTTASAGCNPLFNVNIRAFGPL